MSEEIVTATNGYTTLDRCLACGGSELAHYCDLGHQPLANAFTAESTNLSVYPLGLNVCTECWHSQNLVAVNPHILYDSYAYASGTSATLRRYFADFVTRVESDFDEAAYDDAPCEANIVAPDRWPGQPIRVLDIACNDGSLLKAFQARGHIVFGVDPAKNLSADWGFPGSNDFWNENTATILAETAEPFDVIVAMNVLGHTADPLTFLQLCKKVLAPGGRIYVQTSQAHMVENCEFDTVYHEHLSFFTAVSWLKLAARAGLYVADASIVDIHGGSYLLTLMVREHEEQHCPAVHALWDAERAAGLYDLVTYEHFQQRVKDRLDLTRHALNLYRAGRKVVGYGAAAKAMTFLNALLPAWRHERDHPFAYFVDDSPLKQGMLCPGSGIPVLPPDALDDEPTSLLIVIGAWNMAPEIIERVKARRPDRKDLFLTYFPTLNVRG